LFAWQKGIIVAGLILLFLWIGLAAALVDGQESQERMQIAIESQPLGKSLNELARQTGLQVVLFDEVGADSTVPSLQGIYTPQMALRILLENTGLQYEHIGNRTYIIQREKLKRTN